jgi:hypothetical protein
LHLFDDEHLLYVTAERTDGRRRAAADDERESSTGAEDACVVFSMRVVFRAEVVVFLFESHAFSKMRFDWPPCVAAGATAFAISLRPFRWSAKLNFGLLKSQ